jgi:DNA modification methylase
MPTLTWPSKTPPQPAPGALEADSLVYPQGAGYPDVPAQNRLILGDNLAVLSALIPEYEGRIQLIYADPPFFTNRAYPARVGRGENSRRPQEWQLVDGYPDDWPDIDAYLDMLYPRLALMHRLLSPTGTLYLHLDWHADAYARLLLDEIFGPERLLNEIIWIYHGPSPIRSAFNRKHDTILAYTRSKDYVFNVDAIRQPYDPNTVKTFESSSKAGFGKVPDLERGKVPEDWWYFPVVARLHSERTGYPTQKPAALLERIILASSNPGDLVADFFCGSGTAAVAASQLRRTFLANDVTWRAIHTARTRLVAQTNQPFTLQYESKVDKTSFSKISLPFHSIRLEEKSVEMDQQVIQNVDYWEVDPAWDGKIFRSLAQAYRPRGKEDIPQRIELPVSAGLRPVCVRWVTVQGEQLEAHLK